MTATAQTTNPAHSPTEGEVKAQLWQFERQLLDHALGEADTPRIADDFVRFDEAGEAHGKSSIEGDVSSATGKMSPLWAHFGSADSCCLAYLIAEQDGSTSVCMALWILKNGAWQKTFHHQNANYQ